MPQLAWRSNRGLSSCRLLLTGALIVLLSACQSQLPAPSGATSIQPTAPRSEPGGAAPGGTLVFGLDLEPPTLDPQGMSTIQTIVITSIVGESLVYLDEQHVVQPWLAERWEIADGAATFVFHLRQDVTFQDGTPFNASAVKWNFDHIVDPSFKAGTAASMLAGYAGTDIVDDFTVRVRFTQPMVPFLELAAANQLSMQSPAASGRAGEPGALPVTSGPYRVDEWVPRDHVTISRWAGYQRHAPWSDHAGPGYPERIIWKIIPDQGTRVATVESGETHMIWLLTPPDVTHLQTVGIKLQGTPWGGTAQTLLLNVTRPPTDELAVRRAIAYAVEQESLIATQYVGTPAIGPLTAVVLDDPALRGRERHNPDKARQLLDQAGWRVASDGIRTRDGKRLELVLNKRTDSNSGPVVLLQGQLREVGIDATIKSQSQGAFTQDNAACVNHGVIWSVRSGGMDALYQFFHSSNVGVGLNWACLKDTEIDQALELGRREVDATKRRQLYLQLEQKLMDQAVAVPLVDQVNMLAMRPTITGVRFNGYSYPLLTDVAVSS